jgi:chromosome segregation ATPase
MKTLLVVVVLLVVAFGALAWWQGWFSVTKQDGKPHVEVDLEKFKHDKAAFSKTVAEKAKEYKEKVAGLWKKTEGLKGDDKAQVEKELKELEQKRDRLEKQLQELEEAGEDKFADAKQALSKDLDEVDKKIDALTKKLDKAKDK